MECFTFQSRFSLISIDSSLRRKKKAWCSMLTVIVYNGVLDEKLNFNQTGRIYLKLVEIEECDVDSIVEFVVYLIKFYINFFLR